jgi:hypothetical protein
MGMMIVRHKVRDYGQWRPIFDQHAEIMPKCRRRRALSIHGSIILPIAPGPLMAADSDSSWLQITSDNASSQNGSAGPYMGHELPA